MRGHKAPLLLRSMNHAINQIAITDTLCRIIEQFKGLEIVLTLAISFASESHRLCSKIVFLNHEITEFVVVEVQLNLVIQRRLARRSEKTPSQHLLADIPRLEDNMFLPGLRHGLALVEVHACLVQLCCGNHVDDLSNVFVASLDKSIHHGRWEFEAFSMADGHDTGPDLVHSGTIESNVERSMVEGLHLGKLSADTTTITRRHTVNLIHDENNLLLGSVDILAVASKISEK
ncbi:hypothetical protein HG531_002520 [Fusarium graminearum]|nr:hypothetical protein HG531_002520 [Fusarium graminearum]